MFLPTTKEEMKKKGYKKLDIILISGDTYIDSSYNGIAILGNLLTLKGYKVGVIAQPNIDDDDITRLGEPELFWGISAGLVDSMVANYTATKKRRNNDDFTPGGVNNRRPDRATIVYSNLIRKYFKNTKPIVIGGIEASLRRVPHYDYWGNNIRRSIIFDAKADILIYGMGEKPITELAENLKNGKSYEDTRGICYISKEKKDDYIELPSYDSVKNSKTEFIDMFNMFYLNNDAINSKGLFQQNDEHRYLIHNPPALPLTEEEMDYVYDIDYERDVHPYYKAQGEVKALETIKNSITSHRGCYGECNFCAIAVHQGRLIINRSEESILREANIISKKKDFKGYINDVGGPTANMYNVECDKKIKYGSCKEKRCIFPKKCSKLNINHKKQLNLLEKIRDIKNVKKAFIASGIRYDMILDDKKYGREYLETIIKHHISGQMKIAPEHTEDKVLSQMGKPTKENLKLFKDTFDEINRKENKKQFLTYYLIAAHPNCDEKDMLALKNFVNKELRINPEQIQIFTPTPSTYSTLMYYTEMDPFTRKKIFVEKDTNKKIIQKDIVVRKIGGRK
ncbi:MAG: YgiQ family radical SAM protein [Fusobacteria bacterium]|nr:YgiQ family radical SAM protein [Fusobacteriota bacterium]